MSIQYIVHDCYILSHSDKINDIYRNNVCPDNNGTLDTFEIRKDLFEINTSYHHVSSDDKLVPSSSPLYITNTTGQQEPTMPLTNRDKKRAARKRRREQDVANASASEDPVLREMQMTINNVSAKLKLLRAEAASKNIFSSIRPSDRTTEDHSTNTAAQDFASSIQSHPGVPFGIRGENPEPHAILKTIESTSYLLPPHCKFHANDVCSIDEHLPRNEHFDFVVIDPPWWNRYVRRAKRAKPTAGYDLLDAKNIAEIPLPQFLHDNSLVAIWCTNAPSHLHFVQNVLLPKWGLELLSQWFWVKVTQGGKEVCEFRGVLQKQPFERVFVARKMRRMLNSDDDGDTSDHRFESLRQVRYLFSVPSAVHSHKPPLIDLFQEYLPTTPKCLELFARYLMPNCTSVGFEVLKMQNRQLFVNVVDVNNASSPECDKPNEHEPI